MNISPIILAAGASRRMGQPKQLLSLKGEPVVVHCVKTVLESGLENVMVVTGHYGEQVEKALAGITIKIVFNNEPETGMIGSIKLAVSTLGPEFDAVLIFPCDHVMVRPVTLKALINYSTGKAPFIVRPCYQGRTGHPILVHKDFFPQILKSSTLREVVWSNVDMVHDIYVDDVGVITDIDTWDDYLKVKAWFEGSK